MSSPLSPNVTRVVVREWLHSKNAVLDAILDAVVKKVLPVAEEHAAALVIASINPDPREAIIEHLTQVLCETMRFMANLSAEVETCTLTAALAEEWDRIDARLEEEWTHLAERRARMRGLGPVLDGAPAAQGGVP